jgi:hypothetical protein
MKRKRACLVINPGAGQNLAKPCHFYHRSAINSPCEMAIWC